MSVPDDEQALDKEFVESLVRFDEALRSGNTPTLSTSADAVDISVSSADFLLAQEVLQTLEAAIPRATGRERLPTTPRVPSRIGRFEIEKAIGSGGFAVVYLARDDVLDRQVALKVPHWHVLASPDLRRRFLREAQAAARLDHPYIAPTYEAGEDGDYPYLAIALCTGPTLAEWLKERGEPVPPRTAATLVAHLADAVHYSHEQGVLHRDIKPANVLLFPAPGDQAHDFPFVPRLTDFGLAKVREHDHEQTATSMVVGTPLYMSPEQALGRRDEVGRQTDIYALGGLLYCLLTGRPPFLAAGMMATLQQIADTDPIAPEALNPAVDHDLSVICLKCLEKNPSRRYATARELADDLDRFGRGEPIRARATSAMERTWRLCRRKPLLSGLVAGVAALALGLLATLVWHSRASHQMQREIITRNVELATTVKQLNEALGAVEWQRNLAVANARRVGQMLYAADVRLAAAAVRRGDFRDASRLLALHETGEREFVWRYLDRQVAPPNRLIADVGQKIWYVAFSPDGRLLASAGNRGRVHLFDSSDDYRLVRSWDTGQIEVNGLAFSPDGRTLATTGDDGRAGLWDVETGESLRWFDVIRDGMLFGVAFVRDGKQIVACGRSVDLTFWDVATGELVQSVPTPHERTIETLAVSKGGELLATVGAEGRAVIYRLATGEILHSYQDHYGPVAAAHFSADARWLFTGGRDGAVRQFELGTGSLATILQRPDRITSMDFGPQGHLGVADGGGVITLLDPPSEPSTTQWPTRRAWAATTAQLGSTRIGALVFSRDGGIISGDEFGQVRRWSDLVPPEPRLLEIGSAAYSISAGPERDAIYAACATGIKVLRKAREQVEMLLADSDIRASAWIPATRSLVLGDVRGRVGIARSDQLSEVTWFEVELFEGNPVYRVSPCVSDDLIFAQDELHRVVLVDMGQTRVAARLPNGDFAESLDGRWVAIGRKPQDDIVILSSTTQEQVARLPAHGTSISHLQFARDGSILVSASHDRTAVIWDAATWTARSTLVGHDHAISALCLSPDARTVVTGDEQGVIKLWHTESGQELLELPPFDAGVKRLMFSEDGRQLYGLIGDELLSISID